VMSTIALLSVLRVCVVRVHVHVLGVEKD
jgi:hypothetical protein